MRGGAAHEQGPSEDEGTQGQAILASLLMAMPGFTLLFGLPAVWRLRREA